MIEFKNRLTGTLMAVAPEREAEYLAAGHIASFGMAGVAAITVICYLAATAVKQTPLANKWLPTICGTLGGVLGVLAWCGSVPDFPAGDPLTALAVGIVSGLAATGTNQLIRQLKQPE